MHLGIKSYVEEIIKRYSFEDPILDTSAGWEPNMYEPLFSGRKYLKQDVRDFEPHCIDFICDICDMKLIESQSIGLVLNLEALERIYAPPQAIDEIYRVLKPNGIFILTTYMYYPFRPRGPERYGQLDLWRFSPDGIKYLLRNFKILDMTTEGSGNKFRGIWTVAQKITEEPEKSEIYQTNTAYESEINMNVVPLNFIFPNTISEKEYQEKLKKESMVFRFKNWLSKKMWQIGD